MPDNTFRLPFEAHGLVCSEGSCPASVQPGDQWGEHWTSDDEGDLYCADHNDLNPTSDNYGGNNLE